MQSQLQQWREFGDNNGVSLGQLYLFVSPVEDRGIVWETSHSFFFLQFCLVMQVGQKLLTSPLNGIISQNIIYSFCSNVFFFCFFNITLIDNNASLSLSLSQGYQRSNHFIATQGESLYFCYSKITCVFVLYSC